MHKNDTLWKVVIEEVFDDLLRFLFPDADETYDMERGFEFLDKELAGMYPEPDKASATLYADKLVKVFHRSGREEWVLLHIEVQGDTSKRQEFSERMFRYFYRIFDRYKRPVSAIAVFTGRDANRMPGQFTYTYRRIRLVYEYYTMSVLNFTDEELNNELNPFAQIILAARMSLLEGKIPEQELLERKILVARRLLEKEFSMKKLRAILRFLHNIVLFQDSEMDVKFMEAISSQYKVDNMGIDEFIRWEAKEEAKEAIILNLVRELDLPIEKIASLVGETAEYVNEVIAYDKMTINEKRAYRRI